MKLSLTISPDAPSFAPIALVGDLDDGISGAAKLGYDAVELHVYSLEPERIASIKFLLRTHGLAVSGICHGMAYRGNLSSFSHPDPAQRRKALELMKRHIDLAGEFKTQVISGIVHGNLDQNPAVRQQQWEWMLDGFQQIDRYAGEMGVLFAIEAVNRFETNCFNTCEEIRTFILTHNLKSCRIHLDTFHMNIEEVSIEAAIRLAGENLSYVHCADSNRQYPGSGHLNYPSILTALRQINYQGFLGLEVLPIPDPQTSARKSLEKMRNLLG